MGDDIHEHRKTYHPSRSFKNHSGDTSRELARKPSPSTLRLTCTESHRLHRHPPLSAAPHRPIKLASGLTRRYLQSVAKTSDNVSSPVDETGFSGERTSNTASVPLLPDSVPHHLLPPAASPSASASLGHKRKQSGTESTMLSIAALVSKAHRSATIRWLAEQMR